MLCYRARPLVVGLGTGVRLMTKIAVLIEFELSSTLAVFPTGGSHWWAWALVPGTGARHWWAWALVPTGALDSYLNE